MKRATATAAVVAASLVYAAEVAGGGFFGPVGNTGLVSRSRAVRKLPEEPSSRWLGSRRGARLYGIRGGASSEKFFAFQEKCLSEDIELSWVKRYR